LPIAAVCTFVMIGQNATLGRHDWCAVDVSRSAL
jgi:hypothetical protein